MKWERSRARRGDAVELLQGLIDQSSRSEIAVSRAFSIKSEHLSGLSSVFPPRSRLGSSNRFD